MSDPDFCSGDGCSSVSSVGEDDGGAYAEESFFGPKPWVDGPVTGGRLTKVLQEWVCEAWVLRPGQLEVVKALRPKGKVFCALPTAAGKTLIACANALLDFTAGIAGVHVICQPLQALVGQTATKLVDLYFARTRIVVINWDEQKRGVAVGMMDIDFKDKVVVILSSPEELDDVFNLCSANDVAMRALMIDEAHLREEWPFRDYLASDRFTSIYPEAMVGIFSATMDKILVEQLRSSMGLFGSVVFDRDNVPALKALELQRLNQLVIRCCPLSALKQRVLAAVRDLADSESIVVFASTYDVLSSNYSLLFCSEIAHLRPEAFAAGFVPERKATVIEKFQERKCRFIIATCAFGTGVDFPNIRYVFFDHAPKSWPSFMQHAGRAGRDDFTKQVFITMACGPPDLRLADRRVQILAWYCPKSASGSKSKVICPDCGASHNRPPFKNTEFSGRCFDFDGVACGTTRQACLRTIVGFFQGLFKKEDLTDRAKDCGMCAACDRKDASETRFVAGNKVRVKAGHGKHAGVEGIVVEANSRVKFRRVDGIEYALAATNLSLISAQVHVLPKKAQKSDLDKEERLRFGSLIRAELVRNDLRSDSFFSADVPNEDEIREAAKLKTHPILPQLVFDKLAEQARKKEDAPFDHVSGFNAFFEKHKAGIEAASEAKRKRAKKAIKLRNN